MDPLSKLPKFALVLLFISVIFTVVIADTNKDTEECAQALTGLATCLPYVQGSSRAPTADCCNGLKQLLKTNKKCLCVIVKDGNDPDLGLGINVTIALNMPTVCNAPADVSKCPALLHLDPNSPEAKVFNQFGPASKNTSSSPVGSPVSSPSPSGFTYLLKSLTFFFRLVQAGSRPSSNGEVKSGKRWMGLELIVYGILVGILHF